MNDDVDKCQSKNSKQELLCYDEMTRGIGHDDKPHTRSMIVAIPCPTPMHMVHSA
jgi:hypothetical protein